MHFFEFEADSVDIGDLIVKNIPLSLSYQQEMPCTLQYKKAYGQFLHFLKTYQYTVCLYNPHYTNYIPATLQHLFFFKKRSIYHCKPLPYLSPSPSPSHHRQIGMSAWEYGLLNKLELL